MQSNYGPIVDVLSVGDRPRPTAALNTIVVEVASASLNAADWHRVKGEPHLARLTLGLRAPRDLVPGSDFAGTVVEVGPEVTRFAVDDEVIGCTSDVGQGACAEFVEVPADNAVAKPDDVSFDTAAAVPLAGLTALQAVRDAAGVDAGHRVMVVGASGGVGSMAVQIATWLGASVTGVCSTEKVELVRELGADEVIDYTTTDYLDGSRRFDAIIQVGGTRTARDFRRALNPKGTLLMLGGEGGRRVGPIGRILGGLVLSPFISQRVAMINASVKTDDLHTLAGLLADGTIQPLIGSTIDIDGVSDAIADLEKGHTTGKIVVQIR